MSIVNTISASDDDKLVIPCAGKMFKTTISAKRNQALGICLNKCYLQTSDLKHMLYIMDLFKLESDTFIFVGNIEKVRLSQTGEIVYRQRLFFKSLILLLKKCKTNGISFSLTDDFHIGINNILSCTEDLKYLERYAKKYNETIEEYLTNVCKIRLNVLLEDIGIDTKLNISEVKEGYLDRAPFLIGSYDLDTGSSSIVMTDKDIITINSTLYTKSFDFNILDINIGYTVENVERDMKGGVFDAYSKHR